MKIGIFDLEIGSLETNEFNATLSYKQGILLNWGYFGTKEIALSRGIQNCKKIFGAALDASNKPSFRAKSKEVDAVQWFPESETKDVKLIASATSATPPTAARAFILNLAMVSGPSPNADIT